MKEIMAIIRQERINRTKEELVKAGFPSLTARKVLGRGRMFVDYDLMEEAGGKAIGLSRGTRLMPKRIINVIVKDGDVEEITRVIIKVNRTGNRGDGKIFVLPVEDTYRVRDGKNGDKVL